MLISPEYRIEKCGCCYLFNCRLLNEKFGEEIQNDRTGICGRVSQTADRGRDRNYIASCFLSLNFKIHPILSLLDSALVIGLGAGMPVQPW